MRPRCFGVSFRPLRVSGSRGACSSMVPPPSSRGCKSRPARDAVLARHVPSIRHAGPAGRRRLRPILRGALHNQLPTFRQPLCPIVSGTPHAANAEAEVSLWRVSQRHLRRSPSSRWLLAWLCLASAPLSVRWRRQETSDGAAQSCEICRDALTRQMRE